MAPNSIKQLNTVQSVDRRLRKPNNRNPVNTAAALMGRTACEAGLSWREAIVCLLDFAKLCRVPFFTAAVVLQALSDVYRVIVPVAVPFAVTVASVVS